MVFKFENGVVDIKGDKIMEGSEVIHQKWKKETESHGASAWYI